MFANTQLLYKRQEAADLLRVSLSHLDNEARRGNIRRVTFGSGRNIMVRYRPADIDKYIDEHVSEVGP